MASSRMSGLPQAELDRRSGRWRRLVWQINRWIDEFVLDIEYHWPYLLGWAIGGTILTVGLCRLLLTVTVSAAPMVAAAGVAMIASIGLVCMAILIWAYWRIHLDATAVKPFVVALSISVVTVAVSVEAFAGVTMLLWRHDLVLEQGSDEPDLWQTEQYYLWHLVDSIPLLDIPGGVQWPEPVLVTDPVIGAMLLAFKLLLLAPLLRIGIGAYVLISGQLLEAESRHEELTKRRIVIPWPTLHNSHNRMSPGRLMTWLPVIGILGLQVLVALLMPLVFEPGRVVDAWLTGWIEDGLPAFLRTGPQWLAVAVLVVNLGGLIEIVAVEFLWVRSGQALTQALILHVTVIMMVVLTAAAVNLALLHVGVASVEPQTPPGGQVRATVSAHVWYIADALPGPSIPNTLHWTLQHDFTDRWSTMLILLSKVVVLAVLVFAVGQALLSFSHHARPRKVSPATLTAAASFVDRVRQARADIDRATVAGFAAHTRLWAGFEAVGRRMPRGDLLAAHEMTARQWTGDHQTDGRDEVAAEISAQQSVSGLTDSLDEVATLFGSGEVLKRADAVVAAFHLRLRELRDDHSPFFGARSLEFHSARREEEVQLFEAYCKVAAADLRRANKAVRSAPLDQRDDASAV